MSDSSTPMTPETEALVDAYYLDAHKAAERHMETVHDFHARLDECSNMQEIDALGDDPSFAPYCGCETCYIREVLSAAMPHLEKAVLAEWGLAPR